MKLSDEQKALIEKEYKHYEEFQYAGKSKAERQQMSQFFTPPEITFQMLEKFEKIEGTIFDPSCGSGALLIAAILVGASPDKVFGIELDKSILQQCHKRLCSPSDYKALYNEEISGNPFLKEIGFVPIDNIHHGNALNQDCFIYPKSKYETDYRKGTEYKFIEDAGPFGKVEFVNTDTGKKAFSFGVL